ncbi:DUF4352 domain-containing protein [Desulfosporosinus fructosivorans]|uniref:DUF4352 domain-containing protein n=1 Tax=Desulfosporosinus fructosivorans TaxID=2018669 RepID=A0A4Z0RCC3_9FIRM|nr:DUF4352 domain-containing protein [Desulfosporosinus fructosivorans]TGE39623.1 DUF4352 domain-containing protein [Desulfosporosinus fructosivorans]
MRKLIVGLLIMVMILVVGCGSQSSSSNVKQSDSPQVQEKKNDESKNVSAKNLAIGEKFKLKDWDVTLESFEFNKTVTNKRESMSSSTEDGNKYLILRLNVTNNGTKADGFIKTIDGVSIKVVYNDKYEYKNTKTLFDGDLANDWIQPLASNKGFTVIKVPDKVADDSAGINVIFQLNDQTAQVKIR